MTNLVALTTANASRFAHAKLTRSFSGVATRLVAPAAKAQYLAIASETGVPWFVIAVIHERESSQNFATQLGQGDPLNRVSEHDPKGRGPFADFKSGAIDALVRCGPFAARWRDWSPGGALTLLEQYNGLGYAAKGAPSPYVWSGTDQYHSGKYVRDHVYDPNVIDVQLGCAGLLMAMMAIDPSIKFGGSAAASVPIVVAKTGQVVVAAHPSSVPSITNPAPGSIGAFIASILTAIFKRKTP
jgi:lysozyme family protein